MRADRLGTIQSGLLTDFGSGGSLGGSSSGRTTMPSPPSPGPAEQNEESFFRLPEFSSQEREIEEAEEEPSSFVRTIIRGLGGFVWVIVLIAFTLARNCGED